MIAPCLARPAALEHALSIATAQAISREAAVRRYVALQGECLAAAFLAGGHIRYIEKSKAFPGTAVWTGDPAPPLPSQPRGSDLGTLDAVSADLWLTRPGGVSLFAQVLAQANGHATVLLLAEREAEDGDEAGHRAPWER